MLINNEEEKSNVRQSISKSSNKNDVSVALNDTHQLLEANIMM